MTTLPLLSHTSADSIVAWRSTGAVTVRQFLTEVRQLAALLPAGDHLLNMCSDRYHFSVGLAAAIVAGKTSLLPSNHVPEVIRQIKAFAPDVFCLTDRDECAVDLPRLRYPVIVANAERSDAIPRIDSRQRVAILFTSGSTGVPQPHVKHWGTLVSCVRAQAARMDLPSGASSTFVGTVPPQHMYGFESTVLIAWLTGNAISATHPFYPADIAQALAAIPAPRVLVSTPVHLRALLDAETALPEIACILSATAPLSVRLALDIETRCQTPLVEIYGSTETGVIATRRTTQGAPWHLFPGIRLVAEDNRTRAEGAHVEPPILLNDLIENLDDEHFLLHGRLADLINIAGKRHSLASLNHLLNSIPGVLDGAFFMPDETDPERTTRLAACVVAPTLDAARLLAALRERVDPVFLPRPLLFTDALPRNSAGKLPRSALQSLFAPRQVLTLETENG
jgi:acyl-coenzyme A synthetase/AMP-(fatty) acid ligase